MFKDIPYPLREFPHLLRGVAVNEGFDQHRVPLKYLSAQSLEWAGKLPEVSWVSHIQHDPKQVSESHLSQLTASPVNQFIILQLLRCPPLHLLPSRQFLYQPAKFSK